jgi:glycosyltransferase involved in cell wall biosynthesis
MSLTPTMVPSTFNPAPIRVMFLINDMTVGGAEMLLDQIIRRMDRQRFAPELCCMHHLGELGERLRDVVPVFSNVLKHKYDIPVVARLARLMRGRGADAVVTVGAGDRMFWGRLAAWRAKVPVVISALHSTGWPDRIGRLNRLLTPLTHAFVGVATSHGRYLVEQEGFPAQRVFVILNGVDTNRFRPQPRDPALLEPFGIPRDAKTVGLVAVLRPEKNHELLLRAAQQIRRTEPKTHFVLVGGGPRRADLEQLTARLGLTDAVHFLGPRGDVPQLLPQFDVFALTSKIEASPISILEAEACGVPVAATSVGSVPESVIHEETGLLVPSDDAEALAHAITRILESPPLARSMGEAARKFVVETRSLDVTVRGYEELICRLYQERNPDREHNPVTRQQPQGAARPAAPVPV